MFCDYNIEQQQQQRRRNQHQNFKQQQQQRNPEQQQQQNQFWYKRRKQTKSTTTATTTESLSTSTNVTEFSKRKVSSSFFPIIIINNIGDDDSISNDYKRNSCLSFTLLPILLLSSLIKENFYKKTIILYTKCKLKPCYHYHHYHYHHQTKPKKHQPPLSLFVKPKFVNILMKFHRCKSFSSTKTTTTTTAIYLSIFIQNILIIIIIINQKLYLQKQQEKENGKIVQENQFIDNHQRYRRHRIIKSLKQWIKMTIIKQFWLFFCQIFPIMIMMRNFPKIKKKFPRKFLFIILNFLLLIRPTLSLSNTTTTTTTTMTSLTSSLSPPLSPTSSFPLQEEFSISYFKSSSSSATTISTAAAATTTTTTISTLPIKLPPPQPLFQQKLQQDTVAAADNDDNYHQHYSVIRNVHSYIPSSASSYNNHRSKTLYIAGFFPTSKDIPQGAIGRGVLPAVRLALQHVNESPLFTKYRLDLVWNNTKVMEGFFFF